MLQTLVVSLHMTNKKTTMKKFEIGKTYRGVSGVGECAIEVIGRTEKTITVKTCFGVNKCRINDFYKDAEGARFKSWSFDATDIYSDEQRTEDSYYAAYCR